LSGPFKSIGNLRCSRRCRVRCKRDHSIANSIANNIMQQKGSFSRPCRQAQIAIRKMLGAGDAAYRMGRGDGSARRGRSLIYTTPLLSMQAATQTGLHVLSHNGRMTFQQTTLQWTYRRLQERTNGKAMRLLVQSTLTAGLLHSF